jgi:sterol desaturase/sphingolipid hydroxylase (fatty acid hydroxylase superfamily)
MDELLFILCHFIFLNVIEYSTHLLSHSPKYGFVFYKSHHEHHLVYPPKKLMVESFDDNVEDTRLPYVMLITFGFGVIYNILSFYYYIIFLSETTIYFYIANLLHNSYHLKNPYLERYRWFRYLKKLHHIHHIKVYNNLNITLPITDKLNNTYQVDLNSKYLKKN